MRYPRSPHLSLLITTIIAASLAHHASASGAGIRRLDDDAYRDAADSFSTYIITAFTPWPHAPPSASPTTAIPTDSTPASTTEVRSTTTEPPEPSSTASTPTDSPSMVSTIPTLSATTSSPPVLPTTLHTPALTPEQQAVQGWSEALKLSSPQKDFSGLASDLVPIVSGAASIPAALWLRLRGGRVSFASYLPAVGSFLFGLGALLQQVRGPQVLDSHGNLSHSTLALSYLTALLTSAACLALLLWLIVFHPAPVAAMWLLDRGSTQPLKLEWISSLGRQSLASAWQSIHQWRSPGIDPVRVTLLALAALTAVLEMAWRCTFVRHYEHGHHFQQASAVMQILFVVLRGTTLLVDARKALPRHETLVARLLAIVAVEASLLSALITNFASLFVTASTESPFFRNARALEYLGYLFTSLLSHHACHRLDAEPSRPPTSQRRTWSPSPVLPWPYFVDTPTLGTPSSNGSLQVPFARYHQDSSGNTVTPSGGGVAHQQQQRPRPRPRPRPPNVLDDVRIQGTTEVSVSTTSSSRPVSAHVLDMDFPEQLLSPVSEATALRASTAGSYYTTANESIGYGDGHGDATAAAAARSPTPEKVAPSPSPQPPTRSAKPITPTRRSKPWITPRLANLIASSTSRAPTPGSRGRDSVDSMASHGGSMLLIDNFPTPPRPSSAAWSRKLAASLGGAAARGVSVRSVRGRGRARSRARRGGHDVDGEEAVPFPSSTLTSSGGGRTSSILAPHPWINTSNGAAAAKPSRPDSAGTHRTHVTVTSFFNWQTQQQQAQHQPPRPSFARDSVVSGTSKTTNLLRSSMGFPATPGRTFFASSAPNTATANASAAAVPAVLPRAFPTTTTNTPSNAQPTTPATMVTPAAARYGHERGIPSNASGGSLALFGWRDSVRDRDVQAIWPKVTPAYGGGIGEAPVNPFAGGADDENESEAAAAAQLVKVNRRSAARQLEGEAHVEEDDDNDDHLSASPSHGHSASDIDHRSTQASSSLGWARGSLSPAIASSTPTPPRLTPQPLAAAGGPPPTSGLASEVAVGAEGQEEDEDEEEAYALAATQDDEDEE